MKWLVLPQPSGKRLLLRADLIHKVRETDEGCELAYRLSEHVTNGDGLMFHKIAAPFIAVVSAIEEASKAIDESSSYPS